MLIKGLYQSFLRGVQVNDVVCIKIGFLGSFILNLCKVFLINNILLVKKLQVSIGGVYHLSGSLRQICLFTPNALKNRFPFQVTILQRRFQESCYFQFFHVFIIKKVASCIRQLLVSSMSDSCQSSTRCLTPLWLTNSWQLTADKWRSSATSLTSLHSLHEPCSSTLFNYFKFGLLWTEQFIDTTLGLNCSIGVIYISFTATNYKLSFIIQCSMIRILKLYINKLSPYRNGRKDRKRRSMFTRNTSRRNYLTDFVD